MLMSPDDSYLLCADLVEHHLQGLKRKGELTEEILRAYEREGFGLDGPLYEPLKGNGIICGSSYQGLGVGDLKGEAPQVEEAIYAPQLDESRRYFDLLEKWRKDAQNAREF